MAYTRREIIKFLEADELIELNGKAYTYVRADGAHIVLFLPGGQESISVAYDNIKKIPQVDLRKSEEARQLSLLISAGGVVVAEPDRVAVTPDSGPLLIETFVGDYLFGCVKRVRNEWSETFEEWRVCLDLCANKKSRTAYDSLSTVLPLLNAARGVNEDVDNVVVAGIENMYALQGVDLAKLPSAQDNVKPTAGVRPQTVEPFAVPYLITTQPDGYLPDMNDFTLERAGSIDDGWYSTVPIKGDRALTDGETLSAFLVNRRDGEISRFDCVVQGASALKVDQWPGAFAQYLASQGAAMTAGAWSEDNTFSTATTPLRLWCHAKYRAFTNAPFTANLVQVLACNDHLQLTAGQTLCLQVRDLKTQALFEQHFFQVAEEQAGAGWSRPLCEQINRDSHLLHAGVLGGDCHVVPADNGNAFWGPQCAELSVTLTLANWWESRKVEGSQALDAGTTLHAWVFDGFSHRLLAQHEWSPSTAQLGSEKWLAAWATALNTSEVSAYLRAGVSSPTEDNLKVTATHGLGLWHRGDGLRIFTSLPDVGNRSAGLALELPQGSRTTDDLQVTVRHPFSGQVLHAAVFAPAAEDQSEFDQQAWRAALIEFLKDQAWPELQVQLASQAQMQGDEDIWMPRFCELQVDLDPVAADVESAATVASALPTVTLASGTGSLRITAGIHAGELEFRLNRVAFDKGVRIAACVPVPGEEVPGQAVSGEDVVWPISVTADKITWGALASQCTYEVLLDYPENIYGEKEQTVGHIGAFSETQFWQAPQPVSYTPSSALTPYEPTSLLCEDYGNTERSEIFDTLGQGESGVDPRTGLFHAHYPVATLQGLSGLGPICDLTLHYSALRGNEAGLGDGWAWRFSSLNVRDRCLTLANGMRITFTSEEWQALGEEKPLKKKHCLVQSNKDYSQFTLDLPSGRREVLSKPGVAGSDEEEPNAKFVDDILKMFKAIKQKSKPNFPAVPEHWTQWILLVLSPDGYYIGAKLDYDDALSAWEKHGSVKELDERIAYYERPFVQLLPSRIVSLYGEALELEWKRQKGQFLLMGIKSGEEALFSAEYLTPEPLTPNTSDAQVNLQVWPRSDERFEVKLQLQNYLLRTLTRTQEKTEELTKKQTKKIIQQVNCGYADDPTLDRVLCRLTELDGSVECVQYSPGIRGKGKPLWPQAVLHSLIPGDGQENQLNTYRYTGRLLDTSDQLYIVEGERGAHGAREHHLQVFGLDDQAQRQELLVGSASADSQWLEFKARQSGKAQVIRYTGYGDDLIKAIEQLKMGIKKGKTVLLLGQQRVKYQQAIVELIWSYGRRGRTRLISSIESLLQVCPASQRPALGKAVDMLVTEQDDDDLPIKLITQGQHTLHSTYYPAGGGENIVSAAILNGLSGVSGMPQLSCPKLPDYAVRPLMAEYQCDDFGNSLGLKLFGYRSVQRDGRTFIELEQQIVIEGIGVEGKFDGQFLSSTAWVKTADEVLWRQRITTVSLVAAKTTRGGESKVSKWSLNDEQLTHLGTDTLSLETTRICEDNPNKSFIVVRTISKTQAGSQAVSTERSSRYSQRCLERVEQGIETTWVYDAAGRVVDEAQYRLKPGKKGRADDQKPDARTETRYSADGKLATQIHGNGDESRAYLDGLQRTWRSEWRRAGSRGYLPLYECSLQGLDDSQVMGSCEWDYLPGGQAVVERAQVEPKQGRQPWVSERGTKSGSYESESRSVVNARQEDLEFSYKEFKDIDYASAYFNGLCVLHASRNKPDRDVERVISKLLLNASLVFGDFDYIKMIKFLQSLAGRKGTKCIPVDVYEHKNIEGSVIFGLSRDYLSSIADMEGVEILDFPVFLKDEAAENVFRKLRLCDSHLFNRLDAIHDATTRLVIDQGLSQHRLSQRTTEYLPKTDGTFERTQTLSDGTGQQQLKLNQRLDSNGRVVSSERVVGDETRTYNLERDALGRVTRITRPDGTLIERTYHGFSDQITELKMGGKVVVTQKMLNDSTLRSRKVGSRTYTFDDDTVTLPDKTRLHTQVDAEGVQWSAGDSAVASLTRNEGVTTVASGSTTNDIWKHSFTQPRLPGRIKEAQTTPRGESQSVEWRSLRGTTVATLRGDGHWQRGFVDNEGRVLRTCQEHEDVAYRYNTLGQLQSRQVQALKAGEQWQVLSEHNQFGQEVTRTFLHNGASRFEQRMTWRGDGRLASKASYEGGLLRSTECFSYDELDRLQRYTCDANDAAHCPEDADGKAVKAQVFTWDALDNLVSCVTTGFDDSVVTRAFSYDDSTDPTRMTAIRRGSGPQALIWSDNGYLKAAETHGPTFAYNACGQLSKVSDANDVLLARYEYDGYQRLAAQYVKADESIRELRYDGDELIGEVWFDKDRAITRRTSISAGLAEYDGEQVRWLIDDPQVDVAGQVKDGELRLAPLLPFGEGAVVDEVVVGYNGMRRDPVTGQYHAGNGYRSYDPTLCRYAQPDWLAPVGEGGHNPYQHCPDPINLHDPSGAIMLSRWEQNLVLQNLDQELQDTQAMEVGGKWRGLALSLVLTVVGVVATVFSGGTASMLLFGALTALSVASFGLEVASVLTAESNPELSKALGIASMAVGILSAACFMGTIKAGVSLLKQTISAVGRTVRLIGRGAKAIGRSFVRFFKGQGRLTQVYKAQLGATRLPLRMRLRALMRNVGDYLDAPAAPLQPMPTYDRSGWVGKLRSYWDGPDPLNLTGQPARLYAWANRSRFASKVNEIEGLIIEANILRGMEESSVALAQGDDSSSISLRTRTSLRGDNPYKPRDVRPRYDIWAALGLSG